MIVSPLGQMGCLGMTSISIDEFTGHQIPDA